MRIKRNYIQFTCRMEPELLEKVRRTVLDYDLESTNVLINDCLRFALKNMKVEE